VSIETGVLALDLLDRRQNCFIVDTTVSSNFSISLSNTTTARILTLDIKITGTVAITFPSSFMMDTRETRWNSGTKVLTLEGDTDSPFELSATSDGTNCKLKASGVYE